MSKMSFAENLPEKLLQRKIELCENVLKVYDKIDPGESNQRTNVIFELNCATIFQTKRKLSRKLIKRDDAMVKIKTRSVTHKRNVFFSESDKRMCKCNKKLL